jgi:hypothetical protein
MTYPRPQSPRRPQTPKRACLPPNLPHHGPISAAEVWATLNPLQQSHFVEQLTLVCRNLIRPSHSEENKDERQ